MGIRATRFAPWMCHVCGYVMDTASSLRGNSVPNENDLSICMNCGAPYELKGGKWREMTPDRIVELDVETRRNLTKHQMARIVAGLPDLSRRGQRH
jgi:uncharacterized protein with PIN domain